MTLRVVNPGQFGAHFTRSTVAKEPAHPLSGVSYRNQHGTKTLDGWMNTYSTHREHAVHPEATEGDVTQHTRLANEAYNVVKQVQAGDRFSQTT